MQTQGGGTFSECLGLGPRGCEVCATSGSLLCLCLPCVVWYPLAALMNFYQRRQIVRKYNIEGEDGCCGGCCAGCVLYPCGMAEQNVFLREQREEKRLAEVGALGAGSHPRPGGMGAASFHLPRQHSRGDHDAEPPAPAAMSRNSLLMPPASTLNHPAPRGGIEMSALASDSESAESPPIFKQDEEAKVAQLEPVASPVGLAGRGAGGGDGGGGEGRGGAQGPLNPSMSDEELSAVTFGLKRPTVEEAEVMNPLSTFRGAAAVAQAQRKFRAGAQRKAQ